MPAGLAPSRSPPNKWLAIPDAGSQPSISARLRRAQTRIEAMRPYAETMRELGSSLAAQLAPGDLIVLTIGEPMGKSGGTNTMKIVKVGEHRG